MTDHDKIQEMVRQKDQAPLTLEPAKSALLIIDAQRYFAQPDYPFGQVFDSFRVLVVEDACTELSEEMHRAALFTFSYVFGRVKTTDETIRFFAETAAN